MGNGSPAKPDGAQNAAPTNGSGGQHAPENGGAEEQQTASFTKKHRLGWLHGAQLQNEKAAPNMPKLQSKTCLNLRDVGATMPGRLRGGAIFRSSQLLRWGCALLRSSRSHTAASSNAPGMHATEQERLMSLAASGMTVS